MAKKRKRTPIKRRDEYVVKTTVEVRRDLYNKVRREASERDMTMREYIEEALEEKVGDEHLPLLSEYSDTAIKIYNALSEVMAERLAEIILSTHCSKLGIPVSNLEPKHMKKGSALRKRIRKSVGRFGPEAVEYIEEAYFQKWFEEEKDPAEKI